MKRELLKIAKDLDKENINETEARSLLLGLLSVSGCWEQPKKIELKLEDMASGEMKGNIKGLK